MAKLKKEDIEKAECIKELLESYTEFLEYIHKTDDLQQIRIVGNINYSNWKPVLEEIKNDINELKGK